MSDIRFDCPHCQQSIEAPDELANQLIDCPTCAQAIEVPVGPPAPEVEPAPIPPAPLTPTPIDAPAPAPGHGIFYYFFWGTASLIATLGILGLALELLGGFSMGLLDKLKEIANRESVHPSTEAAKAAPAVRYLPPLTEAQREEAKAIVDRLQVGSVDPLEGIEWLRPRLPDYLYMKTVAYFYIGRQKHGSPLLRFVLRRVSAKPLFIQGYRIKIDGGEPFPWKHESRVKTEPIGDVFWETCDENAKAHAPTLNRILAGKEMLVRMSGHTDSEDVCFYPDCIQRMRDVLLAYRYLGGEWPAN